MSSSVIGIIGSGNIGAGVARLSVTAGLQVVISNSRGPATLADLVGELGESSTADTVSSAVGQADIVVLAVPLGAYRDLPVDALAGKIVVDAMNYYPDRGGRIAELDLSGVSSSEFLQGQWPGVRLVKALNNVDFIRLPRLARVAGATDRTALPLASDDRAAATTVTGFLDAIGFDALNLGGLEESWRFEPGAPLHVAPYFRDLEPVSGDPYQRFLEAVTVAVPMAQAQKLVAAASRA
jgi:predicted dinucleotide-binding enzyme